jgi:SEC-C motif
MPSLKQVISLRLDPDIDVVIRQEAARARLPVSAYVQFVLARALEANGLLGGAGASARAESTQDEVVGAPQGRGAAEVQGRRRLARNALCSCGSGKKFKRCCGR